MSLTYTFMNECLAKSKEYINDFSADLEKEINSLEKQTKERLSIALMGNIKTGKSTFINCFLEEELLPVGVKPTTAAITVIEKALSKKISYTTYEGDLIEEEFNKTRLKEIITGNKIIGNSRISKVKIDYPFLNNGNYRIIDTPGLDDIDEWRSAITMSAINDIDIIVLLFKHPIKNTVLEFIKNELIESQKQKIFFCLTHTDHFDAKDLQRIIDSNSDAIEKFVSLKKVVIFPISLKDVKLELGNTGKVTEEFLNFKESFEKFLRGNKSIQLKISRILIQLLDLLNRAKTELETKSLLMDDNLGDFDQKKQALKEELLRIKSKSIEVENKIDNDLSELFSKVSKSLQKAKRSLIDDAILEINGYTNNDPKPLVESLIPKLIKRELSIWERDNSEIIKKNIMLLYQRIDIELVLDIKRYKVKMMQEEKMNLPQTIRQSVIIPEKHVVTKKFEYQSNEKVQIWTNIGAVALAVISGTYYIAFLPILFDKLFGLGKKKWDKERESLKPIIIQQIENMVDKYIQDYEVKMIGISDELKIRLSKKMKYLEDTINATIEETVEMHNKKLGLNSIEKNKIHRKIENINNLQVEISNNLHKTTGIYNEY